MKVWVYLTAFLTSQFVRPVEVENGLEGEDLLNAVFKFGQNDFQSRPYPSVSVNDLIQLPNGELHRVEPFGFKQLSRQEADEHIRLMDSRNQSHADSYILEHGHCAHIWERDANRAWAEKPSKRNDSDPHIAALAQVGCEEVYTEYNREV